MYGTSISNTALSSLDGSFGSLRTVSGALYIYGTSASLTSLGSTAFQNFQSCTTLYVIPGPMLVCVCER
jgi:hypothetical protein